MGSTPSSPTVRKVDAKGRVVLPKGFAGKTVVVEQISDTELSVKVRRTPRRVPRLADLLKNWPKDDDATRVHDQEPPV